MSLDREGKTIVVVTDSIADSRRALGRRLAAYRLNAGYTQTGFAPLTGYGRSTVANVETGRQRVPLAFWQRCDDLLQADGDLVADAARLETAEREQRRHEAATVQAHRAAQARQRLLGTEHERGEVGSPERPAARWPSVDEAVDDAAGLWADDLFLLTDVPDDTEWVTGLALRWLIAPPDVLVDRPSDSRRVGRGEIELLRAVRLRLKHLDNAHGGGAAFPMTVAFLRHEVAPLLAASHSGTTAPLLFGAVAELALDAGWMAYDGGGHRLARKYMRQALRLSHAADDRSFGGRVLAAMSHHALHLHQVPLAIDLAQAARHGTEGVATPTITAMLAAMEACAHAAAGDRRGCVSALSVAEAALTRATPGDADPPWLEFDEGGLWGHVARAHRDLGDSRAAERYAEQSIARCQTDHSRTRAQRQAILATACVQRRELDRAASVAFDVVQDAWTLRSRTVDEEVAGLAGLLADAPSTVTAPFLKEARSLIAARTSPRS